MVKRKTTTRDLVNQMTGFAYQVDSAKNESYYCNGNWVQKQQEPTSMADKLYGDGLIGGIVQDVVDKVSTATTAIVSPEEAGKAKYKIVNEYIPQMQELDTKTIPTQQAILDQLESGLDWIYEDGSRIWILPEVDTAWYKTNAPSIKAKINYWLKYQDDNKWNLVGNTAKIKAAIWEGLWKPYQKNKSINYNIPNNYWVNPDKLFFFLADIGLLNNVNAPLGYTNKHMQERKAEDAYNAVQSSEAELARIYALAQEEAKKTVLGDIRLDIFTNKTVRKDARESRRTNRKSRSAARKEVDSLIWNLEKKLNPEQRKISADYEAALAQMKVLTDRNLEAEKPSFDAISLIVDAKEKELEAIDLIIDGKEAQLLSFANSYAFAERKNASYQRKDARRDYRVAKRALKATYKELYGKGWKKDTDYKDQKTDLLIDKQDVMAEYGGFGTKALLAVKAGVLYQAPLSGYHLLLVTNAFDLAGRMLRVKQNYPEKYERAKAVYAKFGGRKKDLDQMIENHGRQKPIPRYGDPIGKLLYKNGEPETKINADGSEYLYPTGYEEAGVTASVTAASGLIGAIAAAVGVVADVAGGITGNKDADKELEDMTKDKDWMKSQVDAMDLTPEQKNAVKSWIDQGQSIEEALASAGIQITDTDGEGFDWLLWGGVGLGAVAFIIGGILMFGSKKKG